MSGFGSIQRRRLLPLAMLLLLAGNATSPASAQTPVPNAAEAAPNAATVVSRVNGRDRGKSLVERFAVVLSDKAGSSRERGLNVYRRSNADEEQTVLFFTRPGSIKGTGLLVRDYAAADRDDGLWLYLPALRTVRRVASGGRGQEFFGTDFTLFEVSTDTKLRDDLLDFEVAGRDILEGNACWKLNATPRNPGLARELGYSRAEYWIDEKLWIPRRVLLWNAAGAALKEVQFDDLREEGARWTVHLRKAKNLVNGHRTEFRTESVAYDVELPESLFSESGLSRGPPAGH